MSTAMGRKERKEMTKGSSFKWGTDVFSPVQILHLKRVLFATVEPIFATS